MSSTDERVEWRGESWAVADARYDESPLGVGSHWHLTLTAPEPLATDAALTEGGAG